MGSILALNADAQSIANPLSASFGVTSFPQFIIGDQRELDVYIVDANGDYIDVSGDATAALTVALGDVGAIPTGGTFTLTYGADTTGNIAFDASASDVETALNALASITSAGGVDVIGTTAGFRVTFRSVGTRTAITGDSSDLTPACAVFAMNAEPGDGSTKSVQLIRIRQSVVAYQDTWTIILDPNDGVTPIGWRGELDTNTVEAALALGNNASTTSLELEVQVTTAAGKVTTYCQAPVTMRNDIIDPATLTTVNLPSYLTSAEIAAAYVSKSGDTMAGNLHMDGNSLVDAIIVVNQSTHTIVSGVDNATGNQTLNPSFRVIVGAGGNIATYQSSSEGVGNAPSWATKVTIDADGNLLGARIPAFLDDSISTVGELAGTFYAGGFYDAPAADANLTQASTTQTYGTANTAYGAHAFVVCGGAGSVDAGVVGIRVTGTSITDAGVRTTSDSEVLSADITGLAINQYLETSKKWLGQITFELYTVSGSPTTYSLDFNYGFAAYTDAANKDFTIDSFAANYLAAGNETGLDIELLKHSTTGWTYSAAAFVPGDGVVCQLSTDYSTDDNIGSAKHGQYKRVNLNTAVSGTTDEGYLIRLTTAVNNSIEICNFRVGILVET